MDRPSRSRASAAGRRQALQQARRIVNVFLRQEGHLSADDLVDLIRREDQRHQPRHRLPHAAVDGRRRHRPQGRFRRGALPLRALVPAAAPLPPDLQDLPPIVRVPQLRHRSADRGSRGGAQLHRRAERACRSTARARSAAPAATPADRRRRRPSWCSRATRCASRSPPSAAASSSTRARARITQRRARPQGLPGAGRRKRRSISARSRSATASCCSRIRSSSRGRRSCSSRARPTACSPTAPSSSRKGVDDQQALLIGIRCERGSHRFFKRYGERFEDSEGKQIFLEFADEEREHLELLIREYRALVKRQRQQRGARPNGKTAARASAPMLRDRSPPPHDRVRRPLRPAALVARAAAAGSRRSASPTTTRSPGWRKRGTRPTRTASQLVPGIEITAVDGGRDVHVLGYFIDAERCGARSLSPDCAACPHRTDPGDRAHDCRRSAAPSTSRRSSPRRRASGRSVGRPLVADALVAAGYARRSA